MKRNLGRLAAAWLLLLARTGSAEGLRAVTVARGLDHPWSLAFLPDGSMLVTERPGRLRRVSDQGVVSAPIEGIPPVDARGQGGLLDVALDPAFSSNRLVYLSYAEPGTGAETGRNGTAVARGTLSQDLRRLEGLRVIFRQLPKRGSTAHFGSRLAFRRDGTLFITLGERQAYRDEAQNPASHLGKVVRINSDGSVPLDNPFLGRPGYAPELWSLGHRNVQGAALDPGSGELWTTEHGPQGGDELNLTRAGRNYGWPRISYGCEYGSPVGDCVPVGGASAAPGLEQPVAYWVPVSIAPSGLAFNIGDRYPGWRGQLFLGALAGKALWRIELRDGQVVAREALLQDLGERIRDVRQGPDGWLYLLTDSGSGRVLRLER